MHSENRLLHTQYFSTNCHLHWHSGVRQTSGYSGFTLIELLIVIAITAVLATVAFPVYTSYVNRAKFSEVVNAVQPYKLAAELAVQTQGATLADLDAGTLDIPVSIFAEQSYGKHLGSLDMLDGRITASAKTIVDENNLPLTYILQGQIENDGRITWEVDPSSTCLTNNICSP